MLKKPIKTVDNLPDKTDKKQVKRHLKAQFYVQDNVKDKGNYNK